MGPLEASIRSHLDDSLANRIDYDSFTDWMYGVTWNIDQRGEPGASHLGYAIMLEIAELSNGDATREEFRRGLMDLAEQAPVRSSA